jgi:phage tail sheath protein FI
MAFQISPGVNVSEVDQTTVIPSVLTTAGAFAGNFQWGPADKRIQVSSETQLNSIFSSPDSNTYVSYFTAASFLAYGNNLQVVRAVGTTAKNATGNTAIKIQNEDEFDTTYLNVNSANFYGAFTARYPGALGNSLTVSVLDAGQLQANGAVYETHFNGWSANTIGLSGLVTAAPNTSFEAAAAGASYDELHIAVIDTGGLITGAKNTVLEVFPFLSKASDAKDSLGNSNYYKNYIYNNSKYIYAIDPPSYSTTSSTWGTTLAGKTFATLQTMSGTNSSLSGGSDVPVTDANLITAYGLFDNADEVDISLVITGGASVTVQQHVIDNISSARKDCIAFISPRYSDVVGQSGNETTNIRSWISSLARQSNAGTYAVADSGWKYMFDKYNNTYRYVPLNGDIAGLCVFTDSVRDPWFSPAGFNRGQIKNAVKLSWNPTKTQRDTIYALGVNPVGTFPGQGTVLFGDKTLQSKPSAFDRINVRRLFIVLEKTIAQAAKFSLFEFNDDFTRNQFVALVTPFLRDVKGRRGIYDYRVVCDATNNTSQVIDANQFVGDIYIKPARSINYIQLNFVAVRTGVDFSEVVGQF